MEDEPQEIEDWVQEKILGCGGFGVVSLWKNKITEERIAIKKCRWGTDTLLTAKHKERWTKEVEIMQRIKNENIVSFKKLPEVLEQTLTKFNKIKLPMLSMEYCTRGDLRQVLNRSENCCGLLQSDCRNILSDIKNAVEYLHILKITHRDLKPENIVLQTSNKRDNCIIYKLIDLGYAKELDTKSICASFVGTLQYLAPELMYAKSYSNSVDYWSFGLLAFEVMCGLRPFLPHFIPVEWMKHVKDKSSNDICAYETLSKEIIFSQHMYQENHITSCFKNEIEKWLRIALEWNPKKRGYLNNELVFFSLLDNILRKKIITVFSVYTYEFLSYEIKNDTQVESIQKWVEKDIKLSKTLQFILDMSGNAVEEKHLAKDFFKESHNGPTFYIFKKDAIIQTEENIAPQFPKIVIDMLQNAHRSIPYVHLKRSNSLGLYFVFQENRLYNTLLEACLLKINYLLKKFDETKEKVKKMNDTFLELQAQTEFANQSLHLDIEKAQLFNVLMQDAWKNNFSIIETKIDKVKSATIHITKRFESANRRTNFLNDSSLDVYSKVKEHDLNLSLEEALLCYNEVKTRSQEQRKVNDNCVAMIKIIYNCLKQRDKLLRDKEFHLYIQQIVDITNEYEKIIGTLESAIQHIEKYKKELFSIHIERQIDIWDKFNISKENRLENDIKTFIKPAFIIGNSNIPTETNESYPLTKPLDFIVGDPQLSKINSVSTTVKPEAALDAKNTDNDICNGSFESKLSEYYINSNTAEMISDNLSLRYALQDKTNESFLQYKNILNEKLNFDFLTFEDN